MLIRLVSKVLQSCGFTCRAFETTAGVFEYFDLNPQDEPLLLLDYYLDSGTALDLVESLKQQKKVFHFLVMTGRGDEHLAVGIMKAGALDYIVKSKKFLEHLPLAIEQAWERIHISRQLADSRRQLQLSLGRQKRLNAKILRQKIALEQEQAKTFKLLSNVLPEKIACEILTHGTAKARYYSSVSVLFADVEDFSALAVSCSPIELVQKLDDYFCDFDVVVENLELEKIKTIGDCYMCAGGIPQADPANAFRIVVAGLQFQQIILRKDRQAREKGLKGFGMRIGVHTGEVVAGVVGRKKFAYDIWGDAANTASHMVHAGGVNRLNISRSTYELVGDFFECQPRGKILVKKQKYVEMFFVDSLKPQYASDDKGVIPNALFWEKILEGNNVVNS